MILHVYESNKVLQTEMLFSEVFLSQRLPSSTLTDIIMCKRHQSTGKQKASFIELVLDNSTKNF